MGVVSSGTPLMIVLQLCDNGSLLSFLKKRVGFNALLLNSQLAIMSDVAEGMAYLSEQKSVIHHDLAARNVLVSADFVCKVTYVFIVFNCYCCYYFFYYLFYLSQSMPQTSFLKQK